MKISPIRVLSIACAGLGLVSMFAMSTRELNAAPRGGFRPALPARMPPAMPFAGGPAAGRVTTFPQVGANNFLGGPMGPAFMNRANQYAYNNTIPGGAGIYNRSGFGIYPTGMGGYYAAGFNGYNRYVSSFNGLAASTTYRFANFNGITMNNYANGFTNLNGFNGYNNLYLSGFNNLNPAMGGFVPFKSTGFNGGNGL